jgi:hypothetical protein
MENQTLSKFLQVVQISAGAEGTSILFNNCLNCSLSSVILIALTSTPIISRQNQPKFFSSRQFKAVCPMVGSTQHQFVDVSNLIIDLLFQWFLNKYDRPLKVSHNSCWI